MAFSNRIEGNTILIFLDSQIYSKDGILKCLYWYSEKHRIEFQLAVDSTFKILVSPLDELKQSPDNLTQLLIKLERDLLDFNLRDAITKETQSIRELLTAKAFSNGEYDEKPPGSVSDPVGFIIKESDDGGAN